MQYGRPTFQRWLLPPSTCMQAQHRIIFTSMQENRVDALNQTSFNVFVVCYSIWGGRCDAAVHVDTRHQPLQYSLTRSTWLASLPAPRRLVLTEGARQASNVSVQSIRCCSVILRDVSSIRPAHSVAQLRGRVSNRGRFPEHLRNVINCSRDWGPRISNSLSFKTSTDTQTDDRCS